MRDATVTFDWADGAHSFRLAWGQLAELQEKCDAGPYVVLQRLHSGAWRIEDISNIIRLGLVGGGMEPAQALKLVRRYVEARPPMENLIPAQVILSAALTGAPEEKVGEDDAASQKTNSSTNSQTES
ncbi:gene transfer agent family protein [Agrobacterium deltaense]